MPRPTLTGWVRPAASRWRLVVDRLRPSRLGHAGGGAGTRHEPRRGGHRDHLRPVRSGVAGARRAGARRRRHDRGRQRRLGVGQRRRRRAGLHAPHRSRADAGHRSRRRGASGARGRPRARHAAGRARPRPTIAERVIVSVNASYLTASRTFDDTRTFDLYAEQGELHDGLRRRGSRRRRCRRLRARVAGPGRRRGVHDAQGRSATSSIEGSIPHPLLFNQPRRDRGDRSGHA